MSVKTDKMKAVFLAALDKTTAAERAAFLDEACAEDAALRHSVEALLQAHEQADLLLDRPAADHLVEPSGERAELDESLGFLIPSSQPDSLGRLGHYEILEFLGKGGFGIVFRAFDETLQRVVAIKVLAPTLAATSPARKRFLREARSSAKIRHENVVQVYAVEEQPLPYLVMEFIPGETLQQRLDRCGPLDAGEVVQLGRQIAEGLAAAHRMGLIHRDIKPGNILIEANPHSCVKITDFSLARAADDASLTQSGLLAGTPLFMAPEQAQGDKLDHRADLFSLGSVLYTMCSGRPPFRANNTLAVLKRVAEDTPRPIPEIIPEVPQWLCDLITRLHAKKPEDRFASAQEVADLLAQHLAQGQPPGNVHVLPDVSAVAPPLAPPPALRPRFHSRRWAVAALLLLLLGGLGLTEATGVTKVHGTALRLFSPEGTLVVEVDDPNVSVQVDGSDLVIKGAGVKEIRLKPGKYTVEARKDGKVVRRELITVTKDGRQVVRVSQESAPADFDRLAAEYVLSVGGSIRINEEGRDCEVADLPREPFRLTRVHLMNNKQVNNEGLAHFKGCKNLTSLTLWQTWGINDAGLAHFKDCKNLTELNLTNILVGEEGLAHFKDCKNLTVLILNSIKASDVGVAHFKDCKNLRELNLRGTQVSDVGLANFKECKDLTFLDLEFTHVTQAGLANFKDCKNLVELRLCRTDVKDEGLAHFKDCKDLKSLNLDGSSRISDAGLTHLKGCTSLRQLWVGETQVTAAGIDDLKKALPKCKIEWNGGVIEPR